MNKTRTRILAGIILCILPVLLHSVCFAEALYRCHMCGMDAKKSQTEFIVYLKDGGSEHTCCLHCVYLLQNVFMKDRQIIKLETTDFSTGRLINALTAYYLEGGSLYPKGSMAPFLLGFSDKETAEKYAKRYSGNVLTYNEAMGVTAAFDEVAGKKGKL